ncbi:hypothetical protein [Pigmentiphaga sp.]|uniref:hypothetical protein n=1 Tax=Pigmentiphaga sp. TaxID=1977564 RepID=UPI0025E26A0C|nr:hypothetical protein [Pigmentiphaga sp.]
MTSHPSTLRVILLVLLLFVLLYVVNFFQAVGVGLAFGGGSPFTTIQTGIDLGSRWVLDALVTFGCAWLAGRRARIVTYSCTAILLVLCAILMLISSEVVSLYNYLSLVVLITAVMAGGLTSHWLRTRGSTD